MVFFFFFPSRTDQQSAKPVFCFKKKSPKRPIKSRGSENNDGGHSLEYNASHGPNVEQKKQTQETGNYGTALV